MEKILSEPVDYYVNMKGKNIRSHLCNILGKMLNVSTEDIVLIDDIINIVHNASLVIDDIEDNSLLRRGEPCSHIKYGIPMALNSGYYVFFKLLHKICEIFFVNRITSVIFIIF